MRHLADKFPQKMALANWKQPSGADDNEGFQYGIGGSSEKE